jgi:hypothetical protein
LGLFFFPKTEAEGTSETLAHDVTVQNLNTAARTSDLNICNKSFEILRRKGTAIMDEGQTTFEACLEKLIVAQKIDKFPVFTESVDSLPYSQGQPLVPIQSQINPFHTVPSYFFKVHISFTLMKFQNSVPTSQIDRTPSQHYKLQPLGAV